MVTNPTKKKEDDEVKQGTECLYVKVSMDGAPYLRKVDLKMYSNYKELSLTLEKMFTCFTIEWSETSSLLASSWTVLVVAVVGDCLVAMVEIVSHIAPHTPPFFTISTKFISVHSLLPEPFPFHPDPCFITLDEAAMSTS
ncbi:hypothetical protein ZIOFF_068359 [Zingiber officinale]|uniref:Auxin-responsive protein n=1 Tax=Zingiber officinale TaxID=94328 RepID=A0A8J5EEL9_ZINOF|nr:hypothetical protein ZIOFF_068359 [Zingiber officinale]